MDEQKPGRFCLKGNFVSPEANPTLKIFPKYESFRTWVLSDPDNFYLN